MKTITIISKRNAQATGAPIMRIFFKEFSLGASSAENDQQVKYVILCAKRHLKRQWGSYPYGLWLPTLQAQTGKGPRFTPAT